MNRGYGLIGIGIFSIPLYFAWNAVSPEFGGPELSFLETFAGFWMLQTLSNITKPRPTLSEAIKAFNVALQEFTKKK